MKTAIHVPEHDKISRSGARWRHYRLDPQLDGHADVIVSAAVVPFSGPETYIFAADEAGEVVDWTELDGSYRGGLDHVAALAGAGYEVVVGLTPTPRTP